MTGRKVVAFITDVEGNMKYLRRVVRLIPFVNVDVNGKLELLGPNVHLVYGGDVGDKGPSSLECVFSLAHARLADVRRL